MIKITHNAGFFSCCSIKLDTIVKFVNSNNILPEVDSSYQFRTYKKVISDDITYDYFQHYDDVKITGINSNINYNHKYQFENYSNLDYNNITPLIEKYFSPSDKINNIINNMVDKYNLVYDNTLSVYYRGTDKCKETELASFGEFYDKIKYVIGLNKNLKILIQTDTSQFIDYINDKKIDNITISENETSYSNKGIHNENKREDNYYHMLDFLSTVIIMSKCKYIICGSGNCSLWIMLYKGNNKNIIQNLDGTWYSSM